MDKTGAKMDRIGLALALLAFSAFRPARSGSGQIEQFHSSGGGGQSIAATTTAALQSLCRVRP
jgi:hypothetical protein